MIRLEFTDQDVQDLSNLLDAAVRAAGLKAAKLAVNIADKVQKAIEERDKLSTTKENG